MMFDGPKCIFSFLSFFFSFSWVASTQRNHWNKRVVSKFTPIT